MKSIERATRPTAWFLAIASVILWIPLVVHWLGRDVDFLQDLGFFSGPGTSPEAWILAFIVAGVFSVFTVRNVPLVKEHWRRLSWLKLLALLAAVGAAVIEEAIFRRMLMDAVNDRGGGVVLQVLMSGIVFGLAHGVWGVFTRQFMVAVKAVVATGVLGLALAGVYLLGGRSLAPPIVAHFVTDAVIQPGILLSAFAGTWTQSSPNPKGATGRSG